MVSSRTAGGRSFVAISVVFGKSRPSREEK